MNTVEVLRKSLTEQAFAGLGRPLEAPKRTEARLPPILDGVAAYTVLEPVLPSPARFNEIMDFLGEP